MELLNRTPFAADRFVLQDRDGKDLVIVILKCTYSLKDGEKLKVAEKQVPVQLADEYYGKPGESSIRYESDVIPYKRNMDIVLIGHAYTLKGKTREVDVTLRAGKVHKTLRITGNRFWRKPLGLPSISDPEPFDRIPIIYERSFGGKDLSSPDSRDHDQESRNPVGVGFVAKNSMLDKQEMLLPNIEDPSNLLKNRSDRPKPAGFGFIGRHWQPRISFAGTYDESWMNNRAPLLPLDFDERYYNSAHPDLISSDHLRGEEPVEITNASAQGTLRFSIPKIKLSMAVISTTYDWTCLEPQFDTLIIEPDDSRIIMVWRASLIINSSLHKIGAVRVNADV